MNFGWHCKIWLKLYTFPKGFLAYNYLIFIYLVGRFSLYRIYDLVKGSISGNFNCIVCLIVVFVVIIIVVSVTIVTLW